MNETLKEILIVLLFYITYVLVYISGEKGILKAVSDKICNFFGTATDEAEGRESSIVVEDVPVPDEGAEVATVDIFSLDEMIKFYEEKLNDGPISRQVTEWLKELKRRRAAAEKGGRE